MYLRPIYLILCVAGCAVPFSQFLPWLAEHGPDVPLLLRELFANRIAAFFGLDVILSACALLVFIAYEGSRLKLPLLWLPLAGTLLVGPSFALPLFLLMREQAFVVRAAPPP